MAIRFGVAKRRKRRTRRNARKARRVYRIRRHNPARRRRARRNSPANFRFGRHRPTVIRTAKGWRRAPGSKYFRKPTRINPRNRRRKSYRRHNPKVSLKSLMNKKWLMSVVKIGGGVVLGFMTLPLVNGLIPAANRADYDKYLGLVNVVIGALMFGFIKNKDIKEMGLVVAGMGVYDLIASNVDALKLMPIPRTNALITDMLPEPAASTSTGGKGTSGSYQASRLPVSRAAASGMVGASYPGARAGYLGDSYRASSGFGDNPYEGIDW